MKINNTGRALVIKRGAFKVRIGTGINTYPDYDWLTPIIDKSSNLNFVLDVKLTKTGTVKKKRKKKSND